MTETSVGSRDLRRDIVFAFALAAACGLAWLIRDVLVMLYVSALFAVVLTPIVNSTAQLRLGRWQPFKGSAVLVLLLLVVAGLAAFGFMALPPVIRDLQELARELPMRLPGILDKLKHLPFAQDLDVTDASSRLEGFASQAVSYLLLSIGDWAGRLFDVVIGFVLTIYFILEGDKAYRWFLSFFPHERRERLDKTLQRAEIRMGKWLLGQGSLMLILGVASTIVYLSLHVRYAYALVASIDSWGAVAGIAVFYVIYLQVENSYLTPRIMQNRVGLPGLAILVALLLGSELEGILGAMVSVPTAVLVAVLLDEYLVHREAG